MRNLFSTLLKNKLKVYVARFTNHESNLTCNKTGCCSLRNVVAGSQESTSNFCNNICAFYWSKTKFYLIRNVPATFYNLICCHNYLFGWLLFTAFTAEQRKRDRRRFGHADAVKDGGLSRDELISMFHPEENPHMFTVIVDVRFRYLCVFLLTINN